MFHNKTELLAKVEYRFRLLHVIYMDYNTPNISLMHVESKKTNFKKFPVILKRMLQNYWKIELKCFLMPR